MARLVYACRFDVAAAEGSSEVLSTYQRWFAENYRIRRKLAGFEFDPMTARVVEGLPDEHALSSSVYEEDRDWVVRVRWSFPDDNDGGLRWSNEILVGHFGDRCSVAHLISIESTEYSVAPAKLLFGSPRAVREICTKTQAVVGEMQIKAEPYLLRRGGLNHLLPLLTSNLRKLPVVMLSPYANGQPNRIDPVKLSRNLAGVAVVVSIEDSELTWDFADDVGRELSCFNGAARIYWPNFARNSDPRDHRLFLGTWIEKIGPGAVARNIERAIFAVAAFRYAPDRRISDLVRRVDAAERQKLLVEKKASGDNFWEDYERDLARLDEAEKKIEELEAENANLKANQEVFFAIGTVAPELLGDVEDGPDRSFSSVIDATEAAANRCGNLEILESALSAAVESPFQRPYDIYEALTSLNEIVDTWRTNRDDRGNGGDLLQHLRERGWGKRASMHISDTTRSKYKAHYEFEYQGIKRLFEPHITIGAGDPNSCASIHFIFDMERLKMIVGHVGKHLPNTKT